MAAFDLYDEVDFDGWLQSGLLPELAIGGSNYRVVRRRVIWLIGRWVGVKLSARLRPDVYRSALPGRRLCRTSHQVIGVLNDTLKLLFT